jgi:dynein heavy chain
MQGLQQWQAAAQGGLGALRTPLPSPPAPTLTPFASRFLQVGFMHSFNPKESQGSVERWLIECELAMRDTIKATTRKAFDAYATNPRIQCVLGVLGVLRAVGCCCRVQEGG